MKAPLVLPLALVLGGCAAAPNPRPGDNPATPAASASPATPDAVPEREIEPAPARGDRGQGRRRLLPFGDEVTLAAGHSVTIAGDDDRAYYVVTLREIADSRCPPGVQCVWAGELAALLRVERAEGGDAGADIKLGEQTAREAEALGARVRLAAIDTETATIVVTRGSGEKGQGIVPDVPANE